MEGNRSQMEFGKILSALGLGPKTLDQARGTLAEAANTLSSVNALFTAAGLNLEQMLAAGPDSLKAHLAGLSAKDAELATAQAKVAELEGMLVARSSEVITEKGRADVAVSFLTEIGFVPAATVTGADAKAAFDSHVKQAAALELAKTGHKPVAEVPPPAPGKPATTAETPPLFGLAKVEAAFRAQSAKAAAR
jgi:hypothetical protein